MSEEIFPADFGDQLARTFRQTMGSLTELMEEKFEYRMIDTMDQVNELAREGWTLHSAPGVAGVRLSFVMQRKLGPADAAADLLLQASRLPAPPSTPDDTPDNS